MNGRLLPFDKLRANGVEGPSTLQSKKLNRNTAEQYCASGQGMAVPLQFTHGEEIDSKAAYEHNTEHRQDRHDAKHGGYHDETGRAMPSSGIHDDGNERFAGAKDEDREQDPRGEVDFLLLLVNMNVFVAVGMRMGMLVTVFVKMKMFVRSVSDCPSNAPGQIDQAKSNERPAGDIASK